MLETGQRARSYDGRDPGHLLSSEICRVLAGQARDVLAIPEPQCTHTTDVDESQHEVGSRRGGGGDEDDEPGEDEDAGEDEDVDGDVDS
ncbi:hypothetical protein Tco_1018478 [Tanacetum coccineum]|uniref:Uncharacterized protein n=1 Tax=Tanacetum coccineum TaxID=301880 RepID=A0ABQ5FVW2_9ASTR